MITFSHTHTHIQSHRAFISYSFIITFFPNRNNNICNVKCVKWIIGSRYERETSIYICGAQSVRECWLREFFRWNAYGMFSFYPVILLKLTHTHWIMNMMKVVDAAAAAVVFGTASPIYENETHGSAIQTARKTIKRNSRCNWMLLFSVYIQYMHK